MAAPCRGVSGGDVQRFGPYDLIELVGRGGMGEVYRARHRDQRRDVAVKVLAPSADADGEFAERFRRESYLAANLNDPHVIPIHAYGELEGRLFLEMRLVEGLDLAALLRREGALPVDRAVGLLAQAAAALDAAHAQHLVHRDVKPSNLLVTANDFVYLVDFGLAQVLGTGAAGTSLTATGATIGTLAYMAPERFASRPSGPPADVYALTCVLFESLTGRPPFGADDLPALVHAHLAAPPPRLCDERPDLPRALDDVVAAGLAKDPAARPASATALVENVRGLVARDRAARAARAAGAPGPVPGPPRGPAAPYVPVRPTARDERAAAGPVAGPRTPRSGVIAAGVLVAASILVAAFVLARTLPSPTDGVGAQVPAPAAAGAPRASPEVSTPASTGDRPDLGPSAAGAPVTDVEEPGVGTPRSPDDLGLATPISTPPCTGGLVLIVKSATEPGRYRADVAAALARRPGAGYLLTAATCSSLAPRDPAGNAIYAVYLGPFDSVRAACAARTGVGGDSYVRRLDDVTPPGTIISCS